MNINIITLVIVILIFSLIMGFFSNYSCSIEKFVDNYYSWNWNHPYTITYINSIHPAYHKYNDNNHRYSLSCDFTDDAQPFCSNGLDIPSINQHGIIQNNSN